MSSYIANLINQYVKQYEIMMKAQILILSTRGALVVVAATATLAALLREQSMRKYRGEGEKALRGVM